VVETSARLEELRILLPEPVHGLQHVSAVLGIPRWWPTWARVGVVFAHDVGGSIEDPLLVHLQTQLTERRCLTLRFNFPFAEAGKRRPDSPQTLRRVMRGALAALARDPSAAPAKVFVGGMGLGALAAADLSAARVRVDGLCFLGFPLHPPDKPELASTEPLSRVVAPMLFVQGARDKRCDLGALKQRLTRVGAPTALHVCREADHHFRVLKKSGRTDAEVRDEVLAVVETWIHKTVGAPI
jgi:predicted alpha/beta-hydrolase family hydrolase